MIASTIGPAVPLCLAAALCLLPDGAGRRLRVATDPDGPPLPSGPSGPGDPHAVAAAFDLFAACLRAGMPIAAAAEVVAGAAPAELAAALRLGADRLRLGADPVEAWGEAGDDGPLVDFARAARRSARSGAPLSESVAELAARRRAENEDRVAADIERAGVLVSGPLGLCFLPAFVCIGIVPVVIGLAGDVLGSGLL